MKRSFFLLIAVTLCSIAFAQIKPNTKHLTHKISFTANNYIIYGVASYYAKKFNGRRTANDEIFSSEKFTAACNVFRLNTWIKVTNLRNNKCVIVRVNDRLYYKNKRLVDLTSTAAKELGYYGRGITKVKVERLPVYHID